MCTFSSKACGLSKAGPLGKLRSTVLQEITNLGDPDLLAVGLPLA